MPLSELVLVIMALLATGIVASGLFRRLPIPHTVVLVIIGMALANLSKIWHPLEPLQYFHLTPDLVLFIFLPALIFESGLNLSARQLMKDIAPVLTLAVPALLFSTTAVGVGIWLVTPIDLVVALLFGALISATDPVAVIALFKELGTPERLTVMVEGESLLNDATAIVIVTILLGLLTAAGDSSITIASSAVGQFLFVFFGGALVGAVFGLFICWVMTKFAKETSAVLILSLVLAYMSFVIAEHSLHVSGVMAVVACAIVLGIFGLPRLSHESVETLHETWEFIAEVCNTLLFLFVGLLVDLGSLMGVFGLILFAVFLVQASRASMVYSLVPITEKLFKLPHVTLGERHIMFWGGLKGGLAIAIVLSLPVDMPGRELLINLTLGVVLFTLLVNAPTIKPLIQSLGIDKLSDDERAELKRGLGDALHGSSVLLDNFADSGLLSKTNHHTVSEETVTTLNEWMPEIIGDDEFRHQRLNAIRAEMNELDHLYQSGVLKQYSYLDLRGEILRHRDHVINEHRQGGQEPTRSSNLFLRIEDALIKWLREKNWAAKILSVYQNRRLSNHLMRNIARVLMAEAALNCIRDDKTIHRDHREKLEASYKDHLEYFRSGIAEIREDFPDFLSRFETRLCSRAALVAAMRKVEEAHHDGSITTKVYVYLASRINQAIENIPSLNVPVQELQPRYLIELLPLFSGLSVEALDKIAGFTRPVNYLSGDTIIGIGEHGDALYIIAKGFVEVIVNAEVIAKLEAGDFFGEMALLGDHVRKADVKAVSPCTLLRLNCKDVLNLAKEHTEITDRLNEAKAARS